jgi:hypothetical protein
VTGDPSDNRTGATGGDEIARGKQLLDSGAITEDEFAQIKRRALV